MYTHITQFITTKQKLWSTDYGMLHVYKQVFYIGCLYEYAVASKGTLAQHHIPTLHMNLLTIYCQILLVYSDEIAETTVLNY